MKKIVQLTIPLLSLSACAEGSLSKIFEKKPTDRFSVTIPQDSKPNLKSAKYLASENAIYGLDFDNQTIYITYLGQRTGQQDRIDLAREGPAGIGQAYSLSAHDKDAIFLTTGEGVGKLSMLDHSGDLVKTLKYDFNGLQTPEYTGFRNRNQKDIFIYKDSLLLFPQRVPYRGSRPQAIQHKPIGYYDLTQDEYGLVDFEYPTEYWNQKLLNEFSFVGHEKVLYFGLAAQHFIWEINLERNTTRKIPMKSASFPEKFKGEKEFGDVYERTDYLVTQPNYSSILVDPYRNLLYRIAIIPYDDDAYSKSKSVQLFQYPDNFTVIACRLNGEYVGEFTFLSRTYYPYGMFVSKAGLNIPRSHPEYLITEGSEDEVVYDVYDLNQ